ncbi:hypothetical protein APUTEX25_004296 [Auxenochlorella protothecoides]|uniref:CS domain-containing protein n=1 Tax=Auxenochlorella protothecoides TaxID=3075 RepID=A0A3M7L7C4_AUXPR|nr:hypothetical protein APUTEX25_004296 [Auxenochlorella protothecoides]|eukprot:RMZ57462.1 hypothetical protein APUTEX25_004296 [Auxenochlorella protothecoides]
MDRVAPTETHAYVHNCQKVYEWNQTLSDINIFIDLPPGARAKDLAVSFTTARLTKDLAGAIKVSDSLWTVEDGILVLQLVKAQTGVTWPAAIAGHEVSPDVQTTDQKRLMLERFQAEHPGFDFSQAEFNGARARPLRSDLHVRDSPPVANWAWMGFEVAAGRPWERPEIIAASWLPGGFPSREILKSQRGALMWHGRELRHFKRLLPPPLQQLLTRPGFAPDGAGPGLHAPQRDLTPLPGQGALMHLATDAVRAAADSPFLDGVLGDTRGVLCCLTLPSPLALGVDVGSERALQQHKAAERMAAQAAAGALSQLAGPGCRDLVLCVEVEAAAHSPGDAARGVVRLEATLLALHDAEAAGEVEDLDAGDDGYQPSISSSPVLTPDRRGAAPPSPAGARAAAAGAKRLDAGSWNMLSALAGGTPQARRGGKQEAGGEAQEESAAPSTAKSTSQPASAERRAAAARLEPPLAAGVFGSGRAAPSAHRAERPTPAPRQRPAAPARAAPTADRPAPRVQVARGNDGPAVPAQPPAPPSPALADTQPAQRITVGDDLSDALMAASLDLPPAAARWRQQQRAQAAPPRKVVVWEVDELQPWEEPEEPSGLAALLPGPWVRPRELKINLKQRIAGVLEQDRDEGWGEDAEP